jgi:DNA-binding MarR family transcriptional regulator
MLIFRAVTEAHELGYLIKRAQQAVRNALDPALAQSGLTAAQYAVLYNLARHDGASSADLARLSFVTPQTMARIVADLERKGLLTRTPSPQHGRVFQAHLTTTGARLLGDAQRHIDSIHVQMLEGMSDAQRRQLAAALTRIAERLEDRPSPRR